jgi:hypothetical protein
MRTNLIVEAAAMLLLLSGCESDGSQDQDGDALPDLTEAEIAEAVDEVPVDVPDGDDGDVDAAEDTAGDEEVDPPAGSWIGGPCASEIDCDYADAVCVEEAPGGMCSQECDLYCDDRDGFPVTFCVDAASLPSEVTGFVEGACVSRCDYGAFPETGCREGYGCILVPRANEPETEMYACIPGAVGPPPSDCLEQLSALGVSFEPAYIAPEHPADYPDLTCTIEDPVYLSPPVHGVDLASYYSGESGRVLAACNMAVALVRTVDDLAPHGVTRIFHMGTYNCRVIAGTDTLSRHAYADAIDLGQFELSDGTVYSLEADWEHDTESPATPGGIFLHSASHRWYDARIWAIILTPNYNSDHDNHFHVDMTPGSHYLGYAGGGWFEGYTMGPAPYDD